MSAPAAKDGGPASSSSPARVAFERGPDGELRVVLGGTWKLGAPRPDPRALENELLREPARHVTFDAREVGEWDTALLAWLRTSTQALGPSRAAQSGHGQASTAQAGGARAGPARKGAEQTSAGATDARLPQDARPDDGHGRVEIDRSGLPEGVRSLLDMAERVLEPPRSARRDEPPLLARVGARASRVAQGFVDALDFLGSVVLALARFVTGRAQTRTSDLWRQVQSAGAEAVPIVTLLSLIVGLILAFVGAVQLRLFGADIYVANLVGVAMVREMGAMVVGIIMAGRTGAAYAAQLGTMKVTEEIDALRTFGISAIDFLVVPRIVALFLMTPLLCLYAIVLGCFGGGLVGVLMLGISPQLYLDQSIDAVDLSDLYGGMFRATVYGVIIGITGCLRGMRCGDDAAAVGEATTSAVVTAVVAIVVADGLMAVVFNALGI